MVQIHRGIRCTFITGRRVWHSSAQHAKTLPPEGF
jgi:hypothetical protein